MPANDAGEPERIMSIQHRLNPDSEECQRMAHDNRIAVLVAKQMDMPECLRCGLRIALDYKTVTGCCEDCDYEAAQEENE